MRRVASSIAKEVKKFWLKVDKLVRNPTSHRTFTNVIGKYSLCVYSSTRYDVSAEDLQQGCLITRLF